jgi:lysyl-tRNA synthetase class 2
MAFGRVIIRNIFLISMSLLSRSLWQKARAIQRVRTVPKVYVSNFVPGTPGIVPDDIRTVRLSKLNQITKSGRNPFAYVFPHSDRAVDIKRRYCNLQNGEHDPSANISIAGRVMNRRFFGKLAFFILQDETGIIQLYLDKSHLSSEFDRLSEWTDPGDIIGVKGSVRKTEKGEISVFVSSWEMLTKSLQPLPDKYHGLTDITKRYRHRHLDMVVNSTVRNTLRSRATIISSIRKYLDGVGYLEIETPILNNQHGGAEARPFKTYHNSMDLDLTLRIATELHLKRMLVGGFERVYEIGRIFRNEGISSRHNPEFTSIELYQAYTDYFSMMHLAETLISQLALAVCGSTTIQYQGTTINMAPPWKRASMCEIVKEYCGIDMSALIGTSKVAECRELILRYDQQQQQQHSGVCTSTGIAEKIAKLNSVGEFLNFAFEEYCESKLIQPTFVTDYPVEISPLAKTHRSIPQLVERFELFIVGRELANAFSELTDPIDQRRRFEKQVFVRFDDVAQCTTVAGAHAIYGNCICLRSYCDCTVDYELITSKPYHVNGQSLAAICELCVCVL